MVMKKDRIITSSFRKIKETYRRFLSLLCMAMLGVGFYAGIEATSPDMIKTIDNYYDKNNVYDIEVVSTLGLTEDDVLALENVEGVDKVYGSHSKDVIYKNENEEYVVKEIELNQNINNIELILGSMPQNDNEIIVENSILTDNNLNIGDSITLEDKEYKIVGIARSPLYFGKTRGTSLIGSGKVNYFVYLNNIDMDYYSNIYLTVDGAKDKITSEDEYINLVQNVKDKIENIKTEREDTRYDDVYGEYIKLLEMQNLPVNEDDFTTSKWYIFDRENSQCYSDYVDATKGVSKIGRVFPVVFYFIAILVSLISMTRMVEEDREELGTLKALGFSNRKIVLKYVIYSILATILGGIIGMAIGFNLIPNIVWNIYTLMFSIPNFVTEINFKYGTIGLSIGVICICGSAIFAALKELKNVPATLMRPKAPKLGKKVLLERFPFIWNKFNFQTKITTRNLFRYKTRVLVTLVGISGCTALILAGFGLKDSISDIVDYQYNNVIKYDKIITLNSDANVDDLENKLKENNNIEDIVKSRMETVNIYNSKEDYEINLIVADSSDEINRAISLNDVNNENSNIVLEDEKVVLSQKLAKLLNVDVGENVILKDDADEEHEIVVQAVAENYIGNYAYMLSSTYNDIYGEYSPNAMYITTKDLEDDNALDKEIVENSEVSSIISSEDTVSTVGDMIGSLNSVVLILVVASALLAFVVMYNLSNINISERKREIATLKVLGFYDKEVDSYMTRENIVLTILGISIGLVLGVYLGHFIITSCETENLMFVRHVNVMSYVYSSLITTIFTVIVNIITHFNLKRINMIDSLKSVE